VSIDRVYAECGGPNAKVNDVIARLKQFRRHGNDALHMYLAAKLLGFISCIIILVINY
jgi:hypothetical protein